MSAITKRFFEQVLYFTNDVILDLNGHTIGQSLEHYLQQRFYANIELGSSPFIMNQGPSDKITGSYKAPRQITVMNGKLGLSSHHGLHGNLGTQVLLYNLRIQEFQVAGIALNGFTHSILSNLVVENTTGVADSSVGVPINFQYSQGRFIRPFLRALKNNTAIQGTPSLTVEGTALDIDTIISQLEAKMEETRLAVLGNNYDVIPDVFKNETRLSDGNVYGILLHVQGVAVNGFVGERTVGDGKGNDTIYLKNIIIRNIESTPEETVVVMKYESQNTEFGYNNKNIVKGPVGDVFDIMYNTYAEGHENAGFYKPNVLANAQLILGKYKLVANGGHKAGTTYFTDSIVNWVEVADSSINTFVFDFSEDEEHNKEELEGELVYKYGLDAMAHVMKGNFGLFVSGGLNINATNVRAEESTVDTVLPLPNKDANIDLLIVSSNSEDEMKSNTTYNTVEVL